MKRLGLLAGMLVLLQPAFALEARDLRGLQVELLPLDEPVQVQGVSLQLRVASGPDVQRLAARIEQRWRAQGSVVQRHDTHAWQVVARLDRGRNEVIQWRGTGAAAQLLHSSVDVTRPPAPPVPAAITLPARCAWLRVINGGAGHSTFEQRTASCALRAERVIAAAGAALRAQGWVVEAAGVDALRAVRAGAEGLLRVSPDQQGEGSTLAWLGLRSATAGQPR